jgi:hypothetical protein
VGTTRRIAQPRADRCWSCGAPLRPDAHMCARCGATRGTSYMQAMRGLPPREKRAARPRPAGGSYDRDPMDGRFTSPRRGAPPRSRRPDDRTFLPRADTGLRIGANSPRQYRPFAPAPTMVPYGFELDESGQWTAPRPAVEDDEEQAPFPRRGRPEPTEPLWPYYRQMISVAFSNVFFAVGFGVLGGLIGGTIWCYVTLTLHFDAGFLAILFGYLTGQGVAMGSSHRGFQPIALAVTLTFAGWAACESILHAQGVDLLPLDGAYLLIALVAAVAPTTALPRRDS